MGRSDGDQRGRPGHLDALGLRHLPSWAEVHRVDIEPGGTRPYDEGEWRDALVVVRAGEVDLECHRGGVRSFGAGSVLWLVGLPIHTIRNPGTTEATLVAVRRPKG